MLNKPADLNSLLNITNKFYNVDPTEVKSTPSKEEKDTVKPAPGQGKVKGTGLMGKLLTSFDAGEVRTVTKVSTINKNDLRDPSFGRIRMSLWEKVSRIFSSKRKAS